MIRLAELLEQLTSASTVLLAAGSAQLRGLAFAVLGFSSGFNLSSDNLTDINIPLDAISVLR